MRYRIEYLGLDGRWKWLATRYGSTFRTKALAMSRVEAIEHCDRVAGTWVGQGKYRVVEAE